MLKELNISHSTVYFKLNLLKLVGKYPNKVKTIKKICKESRTEFKWIRLKAYCLC